MKTGKIPPGNIHFAAPKYKTDAAKLKFHGMKYAKTAGEVRI